MRTTARQLSVRIAATVVLAGAVLAAGCATRGDRCYLSMNKYRALRQVFVDTGSMQRVEQLMEEHQWSDCERNQMRYLLEKDLEIEDLKRESTMPTATSAAWTHPDSATREMEDCPHCMALAMARVQPLFPNAKR